MTRLAILAAHMSEYASRAGLCTELCAIGTFCIVSLISATGLGNSMLDPFLTEGGENHFKPP